MKNDMNIKLTERDKKLLLFLLIFVIIVGFVFLAIMPLSKNYQNLKERLDDVNSSKVVNEQKEILYSGLDAEKTSLKKQIDDIAADYYAPMKSDEIDRLLTNLALSLGLSAQELEITMPQAELVLEPYVFSDVQAMDASDYVETVYDLQEDTDADEADEEETDTEVADTEAADTQNTDADEAEVNISGLTAASVTLTVKGDETAMQQLIDTLNHDYPSIRVTGFAWDEDSQITGSGMEGSVTVSDTLRLNLEIYMYAQESE